MFCSLSPEMESIHFGGYGLIHSADEELHETIYTSFSSFLQFFRPDMNYTWFGRIDVLLSLRG